VGRAATASNAARALDGPDRLAGVSGGAVLVAVRSGATSQAEADASAAALAEMVGGTSLEARGTAMGDPALAAGVAVHVVERAAPSTAGTS
jgi:hypothetical protein